MSFNSEFETPFLCFPKLPCRVNSPLFFRDFNCAVRGLMKVQTVEISSNTGKAEIRGRGLGVFEKQPLGNCACRQVV